jgi:hypothetical protein
VDLFSSNIFFFVFLFYFSTYKKKIRGVDAEILYFLFIAFQILPDTSIHCALIEYAYV